MGVFPMLEIGSAGSPYVLCYAAARNVLSRKMRLETFLENQGVENIRGGYKVQIDGSITGRPCWPFFQGYNDPNPAQCALAVMLSDDIVSTSGTYNIMPGIKESEDEPRIRAGAGLLSSEVDTDSLELAGSYSVAYGGFIVGGEHEESLLDFLTNDVAPVLGGYFGVNASGQISFKRYESVITAQTADYTLTDSNSLGGDNVIDDETTRIGAIDIGSDYHWGERRFKERHIAHYMNLKVLYDEGLRKLEVNSRFSDLSFETALTAFDHIYARWGEGALRHTVSVPWDGHLLLPGDSLAYTNSRLPDMQGGQGISSELYEITGVSPDISAGRVRLDIIRRPTCKAIAPVAQIESLAGGSGLEWYIERNGLPGMPWTILSGSGNAADNWAVGFKVSFVDATTGAILSSSGVSEFEITAVFDGGGGTLKTLTFDDVPSLSAGDLVIFATYTTCSAVTATNGLGLTQTDYLFLDTAGANPSGAAHRWG